MSAFDLLHPAVQHHVVNSLGWRGLRPHQEQAIEPILRGEHVLVQAPTAGGKTEAALLPVLSRMLQEGWGSPGVLYLCPIKALLNDLLSRIERIGMLLGRRVAVWHGDIGAGERARIRREPADILLTTPESVEVMLVSRLLDHHRFFRPLRAVVVDEVHAFAGDDRGWHLLSLLERLDRLTERPVQRIALSATLANPDELLDWFTAAAAAPKRVISTPAPASAAADVQIDFVGGVTNAAVVVSRLHRGEKRLVFADSRSQVESLAGELRRLGVETYVSHSSLGVDERRRAEAAFARGTDCVIVATSTLELGLDIGDLDRVIQIDAPYSVAGFLQRIGRTGRRAGAVRNCLFLATTPDAFLRACGIVHLWRGGFVEPVRAPALPFHVLAQQVLGLSLQEAGIGRPGVPDWLRGFLKAAGMDAGAVRTLLEHMVASGILFEEGGLLGVGPAGEARYGRKNFLEVFTVFLSPPLFQVLHGRTEIGTVHESTFTDHRDGPARLSLAGRGWKVTHVDWSRRQAHVEPVEQAGRSRWLGGGQRIHFELAQEVKAVLLGKGTGLPLSSRGRKELESIIEEFGWLEPGATTLVRAENEPPTWWTFAGSRYNAAAAHELRTRGWSASADGLAVVVQSLREDIELPEVLASVAAELAADPRGAIGPGAAEEIKFADCVPAAFLERMLRARLDPVTEAGRVAGMAIGVRVAAASA